MKLKEFREESYYFSQRASEANQKLAIAGIGLIWLFKITEMDKIHFSHQLIWAMIFFILSLALEMIHYAPTSFFWSVLYNKHKDPAGDNDEDVIDDSRVKTVNIIGWILFFCKIISLIVGYIFFFCHIINILNN